MERKIGDIFEFKGVMLAVCEDGDIRCDGCYLYRGMHEKLCSNTNDRIRVGTCNAWKRKDRKNVVFKLIEQNEIGAKRETTKTEKNEKRN